MEKKITIVNPFHNTSVNIMVPTAWPTDEALSNLRMDSATDGPYSSKYTRVARKLCGIEGCECSGMWRASEAE